MTFLPLDPLSWIPDATKREILDGLLKFLMDKAGKTLGDEFTGVLGKLKYSHDCTLPPRRTLAFHRSRRREIGHRIWMLVVVQLMSV